jgi:hypothetical protein
MVINGVSQSTGIERLVEVTSAGAGIGLAIRDRKLGTQLIHIAVPADALMGLLAEQPKGPQFVTGIDSAMKLEVEVRRNEVWLTVGGPDAAVGLDDLLDAVAGANPS